MRASASPSSSGPPPAPGGATHPSPGAAQRAQALLDAAQPVYTLRKRSREGSVVGNGGSAEGEQGGDAMDLDGDDEQADDEEEEEVVVRRASTSRRNSTSSAPSPAAPPPRSTRQLRPRSASDTPGPSQKKPSATAAAAALAAASPSSSSSSKRPGRTGRRASTISDSSLTSLSDLEEEEEEEDDEAEEAQDESGAETATPTSVERDSIFKGLARSPVTGKKLGASAAAASLGATKGMGKGKGRSGKKAAKGKAKAKKPAASAAAAAANKKSHKKKQPAAAAARAGSSSSPAYLRSTPSLDFNDAFEDEDDEDDDGSAFDPAELDEEDPEDDDFDPCFPERGEPKTGAYHSPPAFGSAGRKKGKGKATQSVGGDKKGKGKKAADKAPTTAAKEKERRPSVAERARERARAMGMGPDGEVVDTSFGALPNPSSKSKAKKHPAPSPMFGPGPRLETGFEVPPMPKVQELWERREEVVIEARKEAGRDTHLQKRCEDQIENALELLPTGGQQTALCMTMNRYSAFCGHPSIDIPVFPLTSPKLVLFFSRIPLCPLSRSLLLVRFPQPDPVHSYALPLAGALDPNLTTEEGAYVTQELVRSWVDAMAYAQMATREVWEEVFDPAGAEGRKKDVGLDPARLVGAADGGEGGDEAVHPALRKIHGDEAMREVLRALESVESIRRWEEGKAVAALGATAATANEAGAEEDEGPEKKRTKWTKGGKTVLGPSPVGVRASSSTSNLSAQARLNGTVLSPTTGMPALGYDVVTSTPQDPIRGPSASPSVNGTAVPVINSNANGGSVWDVHPDSSFPRVDRFVQPSSSSSAVPPSAALQTVNGAAPLARYAQQTPLLRANGIVGGFGAVVAPLEGFNPRPPPSASANHALPFGGQPVYAHPPAQAQMNGYATPSVPRRSSTSLLSSGVEGLSFASARGMGTPAGTQWVGENGAGAYASGSGYAPSQPRQSTSFANVYDRPPVPYRPASQAPPLSHNHPHPHSSYQQQQQQGRTRMESAPAGLASFAGPAGGAQQQSQMNGMVGSSAPTPQQQPQPVHQDPQPASATANGAPLQSQQQATNGVVVDNGAHAEQPQAQGGNGGVAGDLDPAQVALEALLASAEASKLADAESADASASRTASAPQEKEDTEMAPAICGAVGAKEPQSAPAQTPSAALEQKQQQQHQHQQQQRDQNLLDAISSALPPSQAQSQPPAPVQEMPPPPIPSSSGHFRSQTAYDPRFSVVSASSTPYPPQQGQPRYYVDESESFRPHGRQVSAPAYLSQQGGYGEYDDLRLSSSMGGHGGGYGYGGASSTPSHPPRQPRQLYQQQPRYQSIELDEFPTQRFRQAAYSHPQSQYAAPAEYDQPSHLPTPPMYQSRRFDPYGAPPPPQQNGYHATAAQGEYDHFLPRGQPVYARPPPLPAANGWPASSSSASAGPSTSIAYATQAYPTPGTPADAQFAGSSMSGAGMAASSGYGFDSAAAAAALGQGQGQGGYAMQVDGGAMGASRVGLGIEMS
ncbi:hypothetical protein JCM6882_008112 [Rhodosporidiobolus microsporus]